MHFPLTLRLAVAIAATALLTGTLGVASASAEPDPVLPSGPATSERSGERAAACNWRARKCWGAISFNKATGRSGYATNRRSKDTAIKDAVRHCKNRPANEGFKDQCIGVRAKNTYVRNGCLAVAFRYLDGAIVEWKKGTAFNRQPAQNQALNALEGPGERYVSAYVCTTRRG